MDQFLNIAEALFIASVVNVNYSMGLFEENRSYGVQLLVVTCRLQYHLHFVLHYFDMFELFIGRTVCLDCFVLKKLFNEVVFTGAFFTYDD